MKAQFISIWDGNVQIRTNCEYNPETGEITETEISNDIEGLECLDREYIVLQDSEEIEVCQCCHEFTVKTALVPNDYDKNLVEVTLCRNHECEYGN